MIATNHYQANAVTTASPAQLVLMLYDGILGAVARAEAAADTGSTEVVHRELVRAQDILSELQVTLDRDRGGVVATNLASLYTYCQDLLIQANVSKDLSRLDGVRRVIADVRDAWEQACVRGADGAAAG